MLIGGLLGTLPDLDVLVQYADAVAGFTYHRSWSHSVLVLSLFSPVIAFLLTRFFPRRWVVALQSQNTSPHQFPAPGFLAWLITVWLILVTHAMLDGFTIYGTQLFWPLPVRPVATGSLFIIDPLYTLPLIIGLCVAWRWRSLARQAACVGLLVSTLYIGVSLVSQEYARRVALESMREQGIETSNVIIAPAPFSVFWRIVSVDDDVYYEGFLSLFDKTRHVKFAQYPTNRKLIDQHKDHWPIARLDWFTNGMISASNESGVLVINDLRMGIESSYVFKFAVGALTSDQVHESKLEPGVSKLLPITIDRDRMNVLLRRVFDDEVDVTQ